MNTGIFTQDKQYARILAQNLFMAGREVGYVCSYYLCGSHIGQPNTPPLQNAVVAMTGQAALELLDVLSHGRDAPKLYLLSEKSEDFVAAYACDFTLSYACGPPNTEAEYRTLAGHLAGRLENVEQPHGTAL